MPDNNNQDDKNQELEQVQGQNEQVDEQNSVQEQEQSQRRVPQRKVIDEVNYKHYVPTPAGPAAVGRGGDELYSKYKGASAEQLQNLLNETATIQDWAQREQGNQAALACLDSEDLREIYFKVKDGFNDYGPIMLMGFKAPNGVAIPRLKVYDKKGEVLEVLSGPDAIEEIRRRGEELNQ